MKLINPPDNAKVIEGLHMKGCCKKKFQGTGRVSDPLMQMGRHLLNSHFSGKEDKKLSGKDLLKPVG